MATEFNCPRSLKLELLDRRIEIGVQRDLLFLQRALRIAQRGEYTDGGSKDDKERTKKQTGPIEWSFISARAYLQPTIARVSAIANADTRRISGSRNAASVPDATVGERYRVYLETWVTDLGVSTSAS